jgi:hypothetical protein
MLYEPAGYRYNTDYMTRQNYRQQIFRDMLIGTLLYSVVIGFYNDYTTILHTRSYSVTFALALVLQLLTFATLWFKKAIVSRSKLITGKMGTAVLIFGVWLVMFLSKFVFLWVIGIVFKESVQLEGFVNILIVVATMLLVQKIIDYIDTRIGY